ncbi:MAG: ABC transporter permease [Armatimonadota bacterium]|nr:ABC transporter permease [Armatimonadota bacterium]
MRSLLLKEWREKRLWLIPLLATTAGFIALGMSYTFSGDLSTYSRWTWPSFLVSLLLGIDSYSRELSKGLVDFLYTKPASWRKTLLAKFTVGFGLIVASALIAAVVYRLCCPAEYVRLATPARLLQGAALATLLMGATYIIGAACSVAIPSPAGSYLVLAAAATLIGARGYLSSEVGQLAQGDAPFWWASGIALGIVAAGLVTVRFGLTLSTSARLKRYAAIALATALVFAPLDYALPRPGWVDRFSPPGIWSSFGPTGEYLVCQDTAAAYHQPRSSDANTVWMARLADGKTGKIKPTAQDTYLANSIMWLAPDTLLFSEHVMKDGMENVETLVHTAQMDRHGKVIQRTVRVGRANTYAEVMPSPGRRLLMVHIRYPRHPQQSSIEFWDSRSLRKVGRTFTIGNCYPRWASDDKIECFANGVKRRVAPIDVPEVK